MAIFAKSALERVLLFLRNLIGVRPHLKQKQDLWQSIERVMAMGDIRIAGSARVLGELSVGPGVRVAQGTVIRSQDGCVHIGHGSMILENSTIVGTPQRPTIIGRKTVFGHKCICLEAEVGDLCEIGNGTIFLPGCKVGDWCIFGEGTIVPAGATIPAESVAVGRPARVIRRLTDADREMITRMRGGDISLSNLAPATISFKSEEEDKMGRLHEFRGKYPSVDPSARVFDTAELTGDVVIGAGSVIAAGVRIIGDSHGPVRVGCDVHIMENTVLHLLPDNELIIEDGVTIGPGCIIHGTTIGSGTIVEAGSIVCDYSRVGSNALVKAGSLVKQRSEVDDNSVVDGFPARQVGRNDQPQARPSWAFRQLD